MIVRNAHVFIDGNFNDVDVRYDETGIQEIGKGLTGDEVLDANGAYLYAGMVDAHCHGGFLRGFNYSTSSGQAAFNGCNHCLSDPGYNLSAD